jgi:hypothetical protein
MFVQSFWQEAKRAGRKTTLEEASAAWIALPDIEK